MTQKNKVKVTIECYPWQASAVAQLGSIIAEFNPDWVGDWANEVMENYFWLTDTICDALGDDPVELSAENRKKFDRFFAAWKAQHD